MAIEQIPGVGPQNTDIASAVVTAGTSAGFAATGPTTTQIAAAVPTLAQITSAVTSNAASAGVTMAAITSSITANAASAGVTIAAITSAGNTAGWGATGGGNRVAYVTSTSTWQHPDGYASPRKVVIIKYNGGTGGNGGCARINTANGQVANGSQGGGSGFAQIVETFISSDLSITIGAGGAGGTPASTSGVASTANLTGNPGAWGGTTTVTGTGVSLSMSNTDFYGYLFGIFSISTTAGKGFSGGGGGNDSTTTSDAIGGTQGFGGFSAAGGSINNGVMGDQSVTANKALQYYGGHLTTLAPGGGGGGGFGRTNTGVGTGAAGGRHGIYSTTSGGTGGTGAIATNANLTGNNGGAGGAMGNGGGGGGAASVYTTSAAYTVTGGTGGAGGAGGVIIYYQENDMKNFAVLNSNNIVVNIITADSKEIAEIFTGEQCIEYDISTFIEMGMIYDLTTNTFLKKEIVVEEPVTE